MSVFIGVLGWIIIAYAALPIVIILIDLEAGLHAGKQRHGRATTMGEALICHLRSSQLDEDRVT